MSRAPLIFLLVILFRPAGVCQQTATLRGVILDEGTGAGVPFAHVGICGKAIGAVSNEKGEFLLNLESYLFEDTVCVSSIGYETFRSPVTDLRNRKYITVRLVQQMSMLNEVIVSDERVTARRVLLKAVENIKKNYPVKPFQLDGYYRDYLKKDNDYISLLESAITVEDMGFRKPDENTGVRIGELRFNDQYIPNFMKYCVKDKSDTIKEIMEGFSPFMHENEFTNLLSNNPVRNHNIEIPIVGLLDEFYKSNLEFEIAYNTEADGKEVYVIKFKPSERYQFHYVQVFGEIDVRVEDFAILKYNYNYYISLTREKKKLYELDVEYREYEGKMFLKYISFVNYFKIYTGDEIAELYQFREFFVNDIHYPRFEPVSPGRRIDRLMPLYMYKTEPDPDFWNHYNRVLLEKPLKE